MISFLDINKINDYFEPQLSNSIRRVLDSYRDKLQQYLQDYDIQTMIYYPIPPHKQKAYTEWCQFSFQTTEKIYSETLSLPISPVINEKEIAGVVEIINNYNE
jgi:dTDP-4-amino-4,6-dideoxygalactose transaminase